MKDANESPACAITDEFVRVGKVATEQINDIHDGMERLVQHTKHLEKLDTIANIIGDQRNMIQEVKNTLIGPATGRDQIGTPTLMLIVKILGAVIFALLFTLVFILTGQKFGLFTLHG